jgi:hypothetical protein
MRPHLLDGELGMEIAIDDVEPGFLAAFSRPDLDIHRLFSRDWIRLT